MVKIDRSGTLIYKQTQVAPAVIFFTDGKLHTLSEPGGASRQPDSRQPAVASGPETDIDAAVFSDWGDPVKFHIITQAVLPVPRVITTMKRTSDSAL